MSITEHKLYDHIKYHKTIKLGDLYFFENNVVAEFYEGIHVSFDSFEEGRMVIKEQFGSNDFGFIANRINSYSIAVTDGASFEKEFKNLKAYAVVSYSSITERIFELENRFFKFNRKHFTLLEDALKWAKNSLEN